MNISALNPFGYEAKTEKGNTYKKSNAWTAGLLGVSVVQESLPYVIKNPRAKYLAKQFSIGQMMPEIIETFAQRTLTPKLRSAAVVYGLVILTIGNIISGRLIDRNRNKKRAAKADKLAESTQKS